MFFELLSSPKYLQNIFAIRRFTNHETLDKPFTSVQCYLLFLACALIPVPKAFPYANEKPFSEKRMLYLYIDYVPYNTVCHSQQIQWELGLRDKCKTTGSEIKAHVSQNGSWIHFSANVNGQDIKPVTTYINASFFLLLMLIIKSNEIKAFALKGGQYMF